MDIDGVLNVIPQGRDVYGSQFHTHLVSNLKSIIDETGAKIVISSTWRMSGLITMVNMWKDRNLPGQIVGITPNIVDDEIQERYYDPEADRGYEIQQYLEDHNDISSYVIIDDDVDMLPHQKKFFVQTSGNSDHPDCIDIGYGLTEICANKAIKILNDKKLIIVNNIKQN